MLRVVRDLTGGTGAASVYFIEYLYKADHGAFGQYWSTDKAGALDVEQRLYAGHGLFRQIGQVLTRLAVDDFSYQSIKLSTVGSVIRDLLHRSCDVVLHTGRKADRCTFDPSAQGYSYLRLRIKTSRVLDYQLSGVDAVDLEQKHPLCVQQNVTAFN